MTVPGTVAFQIEALTRSATGLDHAAVRVILVEVLRARGVVSAWTDVLAPALRLRGERFGRTGDGIHIEHVLSECVRAALTDVAWRPRRWNRDLPVLLAAADGEQHVLPLHALGAGLAEANTRSVMLGASVPLRALTDAATLLHPSAIFVWSHAPDTARAADLPGIRRFQIRTSSVVILGGPGWPRRARGYVGTLGEALDACVAPVGPSRGEPSRGDGATDQLPGVA